MPARSTAGPPAPAIITATAGSAMQAGVVRRYKDLPYGQVFTLKGKYKCVKVKYNKYVFEKVGQPGYKLCTVNPDVYITLEGKSYEDLSGFN